MEYNRHLLGLGVVAAALIISGLTHQFGGRQGKYYSVPLLGTILILGLTYVYDLPDYAYVVAIFVAPLLYHRSVKSKLASAAASIKELKIPELGIKLVPFADPTGTHVAVWAAKELEEGAAAAVDMAPIVGRPEFLKEEDVAAGPQTLRLALDFKGEGEDEYEVILYGESPKPLSGELVIHHKESIGWFTTALPGGSVLEGQRGQEDWMAIRIEPPDYAFRLMDVEAFVALHELFAFETEARQLYATIKGSTIAIGLTSACNKDELPIFLRVGARWIQKVRQTDLGR